jgi:hypothetical protein
MEVVRRYYWKWHVEQLQDLYSLPNVTRVIKARRRWARMAERGGTYEVLVGRPNRKRTLGRPRCRCEDIWKVTFKIWYAGHGRY